MTIVLILVIIIITLVIGPTMTASSYLLRTPAMASSSVGIWFISLKIGFAVATVLIAATLICASETYSSEIGIDCTEVFGLCFSV